jgi:phage terminase small subunit
MSNQEQNLTPKQKLFCEFYVGCGNASESARLAGYSEKSSRAVGAENLTKPDIKKYIESLTQAGSNARIATAIERQEFWTSIMRGQLFEVDDKQIKASEILGKAQGDFINKVEMSGDLKTDTLTDEELDTKIKELVKKLNV